jgi:hypothetical protein
MKNIKSVPKKTSYHFKRFIGDVIEMYFQTFNIFPNMLTIDSDEFMIELVDYLKEKKWYNEENILRWDNYNFISEENEVKVKLIQLPHKVLLLFDLTSDLYGENGYTLFYSSEKGRQLALEIQAFYLKNRKDLQGSTFMISRTYGNMGFQKVNLGKPTHELNLDLNYNNDFKKYHHIINDAISNNKSGLILLHGKPGTGKTSYLKHLMFESPRNTIYLTAEMMDSLTDPDLVKYLLLKKGSILIVEDADEVIRDRRISGNNNAVSVLLNITDGILSELLNMIVICTFNTDIKLIDNALLRKGRLICRYEFKELSKTKTEYIVGKPVTNGLTLADAINYKSESFIIEQNKIGFKAE